MGRHPEKEDDSDNGGHARGSRGGPGPLPDVRWRHVERSPAAGVSTMSMCWVFVVPPPQRATTANATSLLPVILISE